MLWLFFVVVIYSLEPGAGPPFHEAPVYEWAGSEAQCLARLSYVLSHPHALAKAHTEARPVAVVDVVAFAAWRCRPVPFER
jgi:hypothetical protein